MIEASTLGDKEIMQATQIEAQPGSGRIRLKTTLPSGKPLESEFFQESAKTQGMLKWCEAVRQAIVDDDQEERLKTKRRMQEAAAARAVEPVSSPMPPSSTAGTSLAIPAVLGSLSDPGAFLAAALRQAEIDEQHWRGAALSAMANWEKAKADLAKWRQIASSLSPTPAAPTPPATSSGQSVTKEAPTLVIPCNLGYSQYTDDTED